jgi:hypothetical protein
MPEALLREVPRAALVVTDTSSLGADTRSQLAQLVDVYVVTEVRAQSLVRMREPAVVVGVPDSPESAHLVSAAGHEAELRHRHLIVLHAQSRAVQVPGHLMERRWLDAQRFHGTGITSSPSRVVITHRPVTDALRDHVEGDDVLVIGVHPPGDLHADSHDASLLEAPPCDLLLTRAVEPPAGDTTRSPHGLDLTA